MTDLEKAVVEAALAYRRAELRLEDPEPCSYIPEVDRYLSAKHQLRLVSDRAIAAEKVAIR